MPVIHRNGLVVDVIDEGSGPPIVLAHSSVSGNRQWKRLIELLKPRYRVLAPNLFGYGQTTPWTVDGTQTLRDAAEVLLAVADGIDGPLRLVVAQIQPNYYEWDSIDEPETARLFATVTARTLLMRCAAGRLVTHDTIEVLREAFPRWSFVEVGEGGHMAPLSRPDLVNPVLSAFLDTV